MNPHRAKLLIADCHEDTLIPLQKVLEDAGFDTTAVWTADEFLSEIRMQKFDLVLINEYMPGGRCDELLPELQDARLPCVLMLAREGIAAEIADLEPLRTFEIVNKRNCAEILSLVRKMLAEEEQNSAA